MTYREAAAYLTGLVEERIQPGLEPIEQTLEILGQPHRSYPHALVGGTNGKGSTLAFMGSVLSHAGYRVGLYTSPHLHDFEERIRVGNDLLPRDDLPRLVEEVRGTGAVLSYFELATAMALLHFARRGVDLALLEVGLGGRWDATNATDPMLSVITSVDLDHCDWLGPTVEDISREKACIMRSGRPVVLGPAARPGMDVLLDEAVDRGAHPFVANRDFTMEGTGMGFRFKGRAWTVDGLRLGLPGNFQEDNAACAMASIECLRREGFTVTSEAARRGLETARWPGRFQILDGPARLIVDSAHNPAAVRALVRSLDWDTSETVWLFSSLKDKDVRGMVSEIPDKGGKVVVVPLDHTRAMPLDDLAEAFGESGLDVIVVNDISSGLRRALAEAGDGGTVVAAGSIYLAGAVLRSVEKKAGG